MITGRLLQLSRTGRVFLLLCVLSAQAADLPTEVDTVQVGQTVFLMKVQGEVLRKNADGSLTPVASGTSVAPGETLLVRKGASFSIGTTTFAPESHGERWIKFE